MNTERSFRYLLVDDEMDWLRLIKETVQNPDLMTCRDPKEALSLLDQMPIEMLITDTNMGYMSGIDLLREVRSQPRWNKIVVVVLFSGLAGQSLDKNDILKMGANKVFSKPEFLMSWQQVL